MRIRVFLIGLILTLSVCSQTWAGGFTVKRVIPVGPISTGAMYWPAVWSPSGAAVGYVSSGEIRISDTLGNSRRVADFRMTPYRLLWISETEVAISGRIEDSLGIIYDSLLRVDLFTGRKVGVVNSSHHAGQRHTRGETDFSGPYLTVEGVPYYETTVGETRRIHFLTENTSSTAASQSLKAQHTVQVGPQGVFLVTLDQSDSVALPSVSAIELKGLPVQVNRDKTRVLFCGQIMGIADGVRIRLDTLIHKYPPGTMGCDFGFGSFCRNATEAVFEIACDNGHDYEVTSIAAYDYLNHRLTVLDSLLRMSNCSRPSYSPDGRRIAFLSQQVLYFLEREGLR